MLRESNSKRGALYPLFGGSYQLISRVLSLAPWHLLLIVLVRDFMLILPGARRLLQCCPANACTPMKLAVGVEEDYE